MPSIKAPTQPVCLASSRSEMCVQTPSSASHQRLARVPSSSRIFTATLPITETGCPLDRTPHLPRCVRWTQQLRERMLDLTNNSRLSVKTRQSLTVRDLFENNECRRHPQCHYCSPADSNHKKGCDGRATHTVYGDAAG